MKPELGNIRAALNWAVEHAPQEAVQLAGALDWYWSRLGLIAEGRRWIEQCLAEGAEAPSASRARALMVAGWLALQQVDLAQARRDLHSVSPAQSHGEIARLCFERLVPPESARRAVGHGRTAMRRFGAAGRP